MLKQAFKGLATGRWITVTLDKPETFGGRAIPAGPVRIFNSRNFGFVCWRDATGTHLAKQ